MPILLAARPVEGRGWIGHWSPGIGDPSVVGWITVVLYLLVLAFVAVRAMSFHHVDALLGRRVLYLGSTGCSRSAASPSSSRVARLDGGA